MSWYIVVRDAITPGVIAIGPLDSETEATFYRTKDERLKRWPLPVEVVEADGEDDAKQRAWPFVQG